MMEPPCLLCGFFLEEPDDADGKMGEYGNQQEPEQVIGQHDQTDCQQDKGQKDRDDSETVESLNDSFDDT